MRQRLRALRARLAEASRDPERETELERLRAQLTETETRVLSELTRVKEILQVIYDREPEMRERLHTLRAADDYELAFEEAEPIVSIVIPTYDRGELMLERAVPSALGQTYRNVEVVIVGDAAPEDTGRKLAALGDDRVRYTNLAHRGPYPEDKRDLWHVAGIPPRNLGVEQARGRWIAPLDDDDVFDPRHVEMLLEAARRSRAEVVYGRMRCLMNDGSEFLLGTFPPRLGQFGWQSAIFHAGLRTFEMELADALFFSPADWSLCRRLLRAGARFEMIDAVVTDHFESRVDPEYGD
jgi:hypothetical protein